MKMIFNPPMLKPPVPVLCGLLVLLAVLFSSIGYAAETVLSVTGEIKTPMNLTLAEIESMPPETVTARDHDGSTNNYQGISLHTILVRSGVPEGQALRGDALQLCVLVKAADGYKVVFAVAELDPLFAQKEVLLAYRRDGKDLDAKTGPLRLVIPDEKRQGRWVREVTGLEVIRVNPAAKEAP